MMLQAFTFALQATPGGLKDDWTFIQTHGVIMWGGLFAILFLIGWFLKKIYDFLKTNQKTQESFIKFQELFEKFIGSNPWDKCKIEECPLGIILRNMESDIASDRSRLDTISNEINTSLARVHDRIDRSNELQAKMGQSVVAALRGLEEEKNGRH